MNRILFYAIGLALVVGVGALYGSTRYDAGRNDLLATQAGNAAMDRQIQDHMMVAADAGGAKAIRAGEVIQADSAAKTQKSVVTITRYIHDHPAPAVCAMQPDDPVVRELTAGRERANAAARLVSGAHAGGGASTDRP